VRIRRGNKKQKHPNQISRAEAEETSVEGIEDNKEQSYMLKRMLLRRKRKEISKSN
jgi:hypothetical protein